MRGRAICGSWSLDRLLRHRTKVDVFVGATL
jgi:hypothetical protein